VLLGTLASTALWLGVTPALAGGGCFHTTPTDGTGSTVEIADFCFGPTVVHVKPGAEITWVNRDPAAHQVIGVGGAWGSFRELAPGSRVAFRFDGNGVYPYSCMIHPGMVGAVVVGDGSGTAGLESATVVPLTTGGDRVAGRQASVFSGAGSSVPVEALVGGAIGLGLGASLAGVVIRRSRHRRAPVL
jgi:plastocyanin